MQRPKGDEDEEDTFLRKTPMTYTFLDLSLRKNTHDEIQKQHKKEWQKFSLVDHTFNVRMLDKQIAAFKTHALSTNTPKPFGGSGDPNAKVIFILKSPSKIEVEDLEYREAFRNKDGNRIRDFAEQYLGKTPCYFMYLFPFCFTGLTTDYAFSHGLAPQPQKNNDRPKLELGNEEKQTFYNYAKQRIYAIRPKYVVCFGNEVFGAVASNFNANKMIFGGKMKDLIQQVNSKDVFNETDSKSKYMVLYCPHPYVYSQALERLAKAKTCSFYQNNKKFDRVADETTAAQWEDVFSRLNHNIFATKETIQAFNALMSSQTGIKSESVDIMLQDLVANTTQLAKSGEPNTTAKAKRKEPTRSIKLIKNQGILGQGKFTFINTKFDINKEIEKLDKEKETTEDKKLKNKNNRTNKGVKRIKVTKQEETDTIYYSLSDTEQEQEEKKEKNIEEDDSVILINVYDITYN